MTTRNTREDVVRAAGRLFASRGYHGTSMRDLGRELGLNGSSLYSHITSKEDLLVDVVMRGADLFEASARNALETGKTPLERLQLLVAGHVGVVLDHLDEARTFLNEATTLETTLRDTVVEARDRYEQAFRTVMTAGVADGTFRPDLDVRMFVIYLLSILNSVDRWYRPDGPMNRTDLVASVMDCTVRGAEAG